MSTGTPRPYVPLLITSMTFPILVCEPPRASSPHDMHGLGSTRTFASGHVSASHVNGLMSRLIASPPLELFIPQTLGLNMFKWTWVGPQDYTYLLTCVDRFTCWPEAIPLINITTEAVTQAFLSGWISHFGVPATLTSDSGSQLESGLWSQLLALLGIHRTWTTAYHP